MTLWWSRLISKFKHTLCIFKFTSALTRTSYWHILISGSYYYRSKLNSATIYNVTNTNLNNTYHLLLRWLWVDFQNLRGMWGQWNPSVLDVWCDLLISVYGWYKWQSWYKNTDWVLSIFRTSARDDLIPRLTPVDSDSNPVSRDVSMSVVLRVALNEIPRLSYLDFVPVFQMLLATLRWH